MKKLLNLSFVSRLCICMVFSLVLNLGIGYFIKAELRQNKYVVSVEVDYSIASTMQLLFDTGRDFNPIQQINIEVANGSNSLKLPIEVNEGGQLKLLRLDFGNNAELEKVKLNSISLSTENKILFALDEQEIAKNILIFQGLDQVKGSNILIIDRLESEFDPYIVFRPINELMISRWQRTLLLVLPWLVLFFFPVLKWVRQRIKKKEFALFFAALFIASISLKSAWVSFTALLMLAYSLYVFSKKKAFYFSVERIAISGLFIVNLVFIGHGEFSSLAIPLGFVIFPIICSIIDFTVYTDEINEIFTKVFLILMSITIVSWLLLIGYTGYFYNFDFYNYFTDIKASAHLVMSWLYYPHTTFLSFFILIGGIFCWDLFEHQKGTKIFVVTYTFFTIITLLILGSRFALFLAVLLPFLYFIPVNYQKRILIPLWGVLFTTVVYFIDKLDLLRAELWQLTFDQVKKKFWFGHGTGSSDSVLPDYLIINKNDIELIIGINHSHNQYLTYLLENGFLGMMLSVTLLLIVFYHFFKQNNKTMMLVIFSTLLLMVVESPFQTATPLYLISFLFSRGSKKEA